MDPGVHRVCANWQPASFSTAKKTDAENKSAVDTFTAEAGKVYSAEFKVKGTGGGGYVAGGPSAGQPVQGSGTFSGDLVMVNEDEGKYRVKTFALSTSTPKK